MIIAITCDRRAKGPKPLSSKVRPSRPEIFLSEHLVDCVRKAGMEPVILPPGGANSVQEWVLRACDGVIISGGAFDIDPKLYGQAVEARVDKIDQKRTSLELGLARRCLATNKPLLGICGGMQAMVVASGGTLIQDIGTQMPNALEHEQPTDPATGWHTVSLRSGKWRSWFGAAQIQVNSTHHQAVSQLGGFEIVGTTEDGIIEAIEHPMQDFCVGVQWHPELIDISIFTAMAQHIKERR